MLTWQKNTLLNKLLETAHKQAHKQTCLLSNTHLVLFVNSLSYIDVCVLFVNSIEGSYQEEKKHVSKEHVCFLEHLCVLSKNVLKKCVFLPALVWLRLELDCAHCQFVLFAASTKPNVNQTKADKRTHF